MMTAQNHHQRTFTFSARRRASAEELQRFAQLVTREGKDRSTISRVGDAFTVYLDETHDSMMIVPRGEGSEVRVAIHLSSLVDPVNAMSFSAYGVAMLPLLLTDTHAAILGGAGLFVLLGPLVGVLARRSVAHREKRWLADARRVVELLGGSVA